MCFTDYLDFEIEQHRQEIGYSINAYCGMWIRIQRLYTNTVHTFSDLQIPVH